MKRLVSTRRFRQLRSTRTRSRVILTCVSALLVLACAASVLVMVRGRAAGARFTWPEGLTKVFGSRAASTSLPLSPAPPVVTTRTVCPSGCDYATLTAAFADLTTNGVSTATVLELQATYVSTSETYPITVGNISGNSATNTITVVPALGATNLSISSANTTATIDLNGAANVIFDGRPGATGSVKQLTIADTSTATGGTAVRFINEASNNTIRYTTLKSNFPSPTFGVVTFSTTSGVNGNDNNTIDNCDIDGGAGATASPTSGVAQNGIFSLGTTTTVARNNSGNTISNNNIFNNFVTGVAATSAGILLAVGNTDWTISGNSIYQTATRTATVGAATIYGISIANSASGNNFVVTGNFIGGSAASAGGTAWTINGAFGNRFNAIGLNVGSTTASSVQGNTVTNFSFLTTSTFTSNSTSPLATGVWGGIYVAAGKANVGTITGNIIGSGTGTGSILVTGQTNPGATANGLGVSGADTVNISNNTVGSITTSGATAAISTGIIGINSNAVGAITVNNNTIGSTTTANSLNASLASTGTTTQVVIGIKNTGGSNFAITNNTIANLNNAYVPSSANVNNIMAGISTSNGLVTITGNTIRNLSTAANANGVGANSSVQGIQNTSTIDPLTITGNTIRSIANNNNTGATVVLGIYNAGQFTGTNIIARNFIHSLTNLSTAGFMNGIDVPGGAATYRNNMIVLGNGLTNAVLINGINETGGTNNFYHNSIYIGGANVFSGSTPTNAFTSITSGTRNYRDNIFVNARSNTSGTGKHYAVRYGGAGSNPSGLTTNNNIYLASGVGGVFGFFNSADRANLAAWQTATGQDANSFESDPQYLDPANATTPNLHINPTVATLVESSGADVGVTDDFDTDIRANFTPVDLGADAGNFTSGGDFAPPIIAYTTLPNTASTSNRTLTISVSDFSGVPTSGTGLPRLYFRKGASGGFATTQCSFVSGSSYSCTFDYSLVAGASVAVGDAVQYYVVAQDAAPSPNVAANPSAGAAGFTASPPAVSTPPTTPNSYNITGAFTGTYSVCDGATYATLKSFFDAVNGAVVTGNITVNVLGPCSETATASLNQWLEEPAGSNFTMLIQPGGGAARTITGAINGALIKLNGADRVTIDGLNSGGNSLALTNNNTSGTGIWLASLGLGAGATNNTIRNIIITGNSTNTSGSGVDVSGSTISSSGGDNDGNTIQGNTITKFGSGISVNGSGTVSAGGVDGLIVANNIVGPATAGANNILSTGIVISSAVAPSITGNTVRNVVSTSFGSSTEGIGLLFVTNAVVTKNTVSNISTSGSSAFAFGVLVHEGCTGAQVTGNKITGVITTDAAGQSAKGIYVNTETTASNVTVANNVVSDIQSASGTGTDFLRQPVGIYLDGATGGINLYHNSVNLFGSHAGASGVTLQAALFVNTSVTAVDLRDNIFADSYDNSSSATDKSYAIYSRAPATSFTTINYNDYYASGPTGVLGFLVADRADISAWRTATGQDVNSLASNPQFASTADLHITRTSPSVLSPVENVGISIGGITTDFENDTRANPPDIGADEVTAMGFQSAVFVTPENGGSSFNTITVTRTAGSGNAASVNYATGDAAATGGPVCTAGIDYISTSGTLNFAAGETSKTFQITLCDDAVYEGNEDVSLTLSSPVGSIVGPFNPAVFSITDNESAPETDVAVAGGNLVISDANGGATDDTLTISLVAGPNIRIHDPSHTLSAGAGASQVDPNTVDVLLGSVTGNIQVNTLAGNDILTLDLSGGDFIPGAGLTFNGGNPTTGPGDKLSITGGSQGSVTYNYINAHDGSILMQNFGKVNYTGLEPITNSGTATDVVFNLPAGPNAATLADDGTSGNTLSRLSAATIETTDFANPTGSLTINRGNAGDTLAVNALPDFNASLTLGSVGSEFNTIIFNGGVTLAANKNLFGNASGTINLSNGTSALTTSGAGTISLAGANVTGSGNVSTGGGLTVSTSGPDSTLNTLSGVISGTGGLTILSSNALAFNSVALTGANTYTGVTTLSGNGRPVEVKVGSLADGGLPSAIGASSNAAANLVFAGISMFTYTGAATSTNRLFTLSGPSDSSLEILSNGTGEVAFTNPGALVFGSSGNVSFVIYGTNNGSFAPVIGNRTGGVTNLSKGDNDTWTLSGANTYTGATDIEMGTLSVSLLADGGVASNIGASTNAAPNLSVRGTLKYTGSGANTDRLFKLGSDGGAIDSSGSGALNFTNTNAIDTDDLNTANAAFTLAGANTGANTFAPKVNDGASANIVPLTKTGAGAWNLSGVNTYTGATSVNAGRLNINGSITSNVTVADTSTLGGTGTIYSANTVTVQSGGTVAPGTSPGLLNTGNVTFDSSSTFAVEINGPTAGSGYDQLNVTGTVSLSDAVLSLTGSHNPSEGEQFIIVNNDGSEAIIGTFNGLPEGTIIPAFFSSGYGPAKISYVGGDGNDVVLTVVAATITLAVSPSSGMEDSGSTINYTFTRSIITGTQMVNFSVGGTADSATDYGASGADTFGATSGTVTFAANSATAIVSITPSADSDYEANETVTLTVTSGVDYNVGSPASATATIDNDDAPSSTLVVTKTADTNNICLPGDCSLREAIAAANTNADTNTITFDIPGAGPHTIQLTSALNNLAENVNLNGPADESVTVRGEGADNPYRIFVINSGKTVTISNLNITNGLATGASPDNCGGGIFNNHGTLTVGGSAIYLNNADSGAGICNFGQGGPSATLTVFNSTLSGNVATGQGGGIYNDGYNSGSASLTVVNSTLSENRGPAGGGAVLNTTDNFGSAIVLVRNSIFQSLAVPGIEENIKTSGGGALVTSQGHNLSDDKAGDGPETGPGGYLNATGDIRNTNPRLGSLADNGGPTLTHELLPGSPAIEGGDDCVLTGCSGASPFVTTDQRGVARPQSTHVDMGAFELQAYVVTKTADTNNTCLPGDCSLREAIKAANSDAPNPRMISFNIPSSDTGYDVNGVCTITPSTYVLPPITNSVLIDGYSQPGSKQNGLDLDAGDDAVLKIQLSGTDLADGSLGLDLHYGAEWSVVRGLIINDFKGAGVWIENEGANQISGNFIGTNAAGTAAVANGDGVAIVYGLFHLLGGDLPGERNVISGNTTNGIRMTGDETNVNFVEGNYIGTTKNGDAALGNAVGVYINDDSAGNVIGCEVINGDNLISGNSSAGVRIEESSDNLVEGNFIGTDKTGATAIPNVTGVDLKNAPLNTVGTPDFGNLISGNSGTGLWIQSTPESGSPSSTNDVQGNRIGINFTGTAALANNVGVLIHDASDNLIGGGNTSGDRNYISGNLLEGIRIEVSGSTAVSDGNQIFGNSIGTNVAGTAAIPNQGSGIKIVGGFFNEVGCTFTGSGNLISGNKGEGVELTGGAGNNFVQGNLIGVQSDATSALGNGGSGVEIYSLPSGPSSNNVVGVFQNEEVDRTRLDSIAAKTGPCRAQPERNALKEGKAKAIRQAPQKTEALAAAGTTPKRAAAVRPPRQIQRAKRSPQGRFAPLTKASQALTPSAKQATRMGPAIAPPQTVTVNGGNVIAFNVDDGVKISSAGDLNNLISQNSIYSNGKLGINLVGGTESAEVTDNDIGDGDPGPNNLQNFPAITDAAADTQIIYGTLDSSIEDEPFTIEFFVNADCDGSGNGEGKTFIGSTQTGLDNFSFTAPAGSFTAGQTITATATDVKGNTSEFSSCFLASQTTAGADLYIEKSDSPDPVSTGNTLTYTLTVFSNGPAPANNVVVTDTLPASVTLVSSTPSQGSACTGTTTLTCNLGTVNFGETPTVIIVVTAPNTAGVISNLASVSSPDDLVTENNSDSEDTNVIGCPSSFTVNDNGDASDATPGDKVCATAGAVCTLRAAIEEANALTSCGTITIDATGISGAISLGTALDSIGHNVNINGPGANLLTVQRGGASGFRIFTINPNMTVSISGLTISNGSAAIGGGIYNNRGALTISNSTISGNTASSAGGGIHNGGIGAGNAALMITNSTIRGNSSTGDGGGVSSDAGSGTASLIMIDNTVSGNTANNQGGGVNVISSMATLTNVTVTNNRSDNDNIAGGVGGGLYESSGTVTLQNTIVAGNFRGGSTTRDDINGSLQVASSYNLIGDGTGITGVGSLPSNNQIGTSGSPIDPLLGALQDNGGPTFTHGLLYNSPAIDKGDNAVTGSPLLLTTDQRGSGFARQADSDLTAGAIVDIGAYERQATESRDVPGGSNIQVNLVDAILTFPCVNCGGFVSRKAGAQTRPGLNPAGAPSASITVIDPASQPTPPLGYVIGNNSSPPLPAFDLSTTASSNPPIGVCFYLPSINDQTFFNGLKVLHREAGQNQVYGDSDDVLVDRTRAINPIDFSSRLVCGEVDSFSAFVIGHTATPTAANGNVSGQILDSNGHPVEGAGIRMSGTQNRLTVTDANGNYRFDNVETNGFYTVVPSRANYSFSPSQRSFSALGQQTDAAFNASGTSNGLNPLDTTEYFVRQQYLDFLGREPDEAGLNFWYRNIESCGDNGNCRTAKRIDTSAAFFLSIEFQQTGYLVYRTYRAAYGDLPGPPVPLRLNEFKPDTAAIGNGVIVNKNGWETQLEQNKQVFMSEFGQRPRFVTEYPLTLTPVEFVDHLFVNAGVAPSTEARSLAIGEFGSQANSADAAARGRALRRVAENSVLARRQFNQAFVLMQYFGYLRRDANAGQDTDFSGYNFWLNKLNTFDGNFGDAEMVKAFLVSGEYRGRFPR